MEGESALRTDYEYEEEEVSGSVPDESHQATEADIAEVGEASGAVGCKDGNHHPFYCVLMAYNAIQIILEQYKVDHLMGDGYELHMLPKDAGTVTWGPQVPNAHKYFGCDEVAIDVDLYFPLHGILSFGTSWSAMT